MTAATGTTDADATIGHGNPALSILALDDDADFREFLQGLLEGEGHTVRTAATPDECLKACEADLPDVLLLDLDMGEFSGEKVLADVKKRWPRQCVVIITGHPSMESMRSSFRQDVYDYLTKPFSTDDLRRVLDQAAVAFNLGGQALDRLRMELGRQIRIARTELGWTLKELSEASSVSVSQLSSIERGAHLPSVESLVSVSSALGSKPSVWLDAAGF
ncbi:MAG: response regulator [Planctomycetota bacterium]